MRLSIDNNFDGVFEETLTLNKDIVASDIYKTSLKDLLLNELFLLFMLINVALAGIFVWIKRLEKELKRRGL